MPKRSLNKKSMNKRAFKPRRAFSVPVREETIKVLAEPVKSESDKKLYRSIRLQNGMTALLISDPSLPPPEEHSSSEEESASASSSSDSTDSTFTSTSSGCRTSRRQPEFDEEKTAACALCVGAGSYSDPPALQGLAHFVEHMVFMGSSKYPKENEFDAFITKKGGSDNAVTDCEQTTFHFEIEEKYLLRAMDMFSQCFVDPLMLKGAMQRERESIDSEFAIFAPSDSNRMEQLLSSLFPEGHPSRMFSWGNLKSLRDDVADDDKLYEAAHEFRDRHYSAHRMTLAVQARLSLDILQRYVVDTFGQIPSNDLPPKDFSPYAFTPEQITSEFSSIYYVKPISDTTQVHLTWCIRSLIPEYQSKPHQYVSYLLGHEGRGSLLSYLRKNVWALEIDTGTPESGKDYTSMYSLFSINIALTDDGLDHIDEVLEAVFSYINMLRHVGPSERIYNEIKMIMDTDFRFSEESEPADYVGALAENMHLFPPEHFITGDELFYKYDPKGITEVLASMKPEKVNIMILSNKYSTPIEYDAVEKWFGTEYHREDIPDKWLDRWAKVEPYKCFHLPDENVYITNNFDLIPPAEPYVHEARELGVDLMSSSAKDVYKKVAAKTEHKQVIFKEGDTTAIVSNFRLDQPNLLRKNDFVELWYKPDFKFRLPTTVLYFYFITPLSLRSAREACLLDLWTDVLEQKLKSAYNNYGQVLTSRCFLFQESVYPANMANLTHSFYVENRGLTLKIIGYSEHLHLLVDLLSREMRAATQGLSEAMFEAVREECARDYHNMLIDPHKLAKDVRMSVMVDPYVSPREQADVVRSITADKLRRFNDDFLDRLYMQVLIQGNISWQEAIRISETVLNNIKFEPLSRNELPEIKVRELPVGEKKLRIMSLDTTSTNSVVSNYYQCGVTTPQEDAVLQVLLTLMEEPVFDQLRTKEQLGYSVFTMVRDTFGVLGYSITVNTQVDKFSKVLAARSSPSDNSAPHHVRSPSSVAHVDSRIEAFLRKFGRDCRRLAERALAEARRALLQLKHTADYDLEEEASLAIERAYDLPPNCREKLAGDRLWGISLQQTFIGGLHLSGYHRSTHLMFHPLARLAIRSYNHAASTHPTTCPYTYPNIYPSFSRAEAIEKVKISDLRSWIGDHLPSGNKKLYKDVNTDPPPVHTKSLPWVHVRFGSHALPRLTPIRQAQCTSAYIPAVLYNITYCTYLIISQIVGHKDEKSNDVEPGTNKSHDITYLGPYEDADEDKDNFVLDVEEFKTNLPILPVPKVELIQC
ncbi:Nardilysin [Eumeta japonica]|uniref:Nardilysin n=1 Tax=Eumeta variegata TaxID=151549 RepID=A0A4C1VNK5_EUMVA|nr:Nardilysin [Eumeta japonica]